MKENIDPYDSLERLLSLARVGFENRWNSFSTAGSPGVKYDAVVEIHAIILKTKLFL